MLKRKEIESHETASLLAARMAAYTSGMDVHALPLEALDDAPPSWNFYKPLPDEKFMELVESIEANGVISPLIVWERAGEDGAERYMILSGHNRRRALERLHQATGDARYATAQCVVKKREEITHEQAREILVDSNWVQRTLSPAERARSIYSKYVALGRQQRGSGRRGYEAVAEHFGLKATQVYQYTRLATLEELWLSRLDEGKLSVKAASRLVDFTPEQRAAIAPMGPTSAEILLLPRELPPEDLPGALAGLTSRSVELRFAVPWDKAEAVRAAVRAVLRDPGGEALQDGIRRAP